MDTITAAEYVALDRKPIVVYTYRQGAFLEGRRVQVGNAATMPPDWIQHGRSIALIAINGGKVYVTPETLLEVSDGR